jgi:hypothetical protein
VGDSEGSNVGNVVGILEGQLVVGALGTLLGILEGKDV